MFLDRYVCLEVPTKMLFGGIMKIPVSIILIAVAFSLNVSAQDGDPANFQIIYGNRDGSVIDARPGDTIEVQCWGATSPPGNADSPDSIVYMHNPLMTNDDIIIARLGGTFPDTLVGRWDDTRFLAPDGNGNVPSIPEGFTSQSMFGLAYLILPVDEQNFFYTQGDTVLICTFLMQISTNPDYIGQTVCPFSEGQNGPNGGLQWGFMTGRNNVVPTQTFGCIHIDTSCSYISGDANDDGILNGLDAVYSVAYFKGGPRPHSCECTPGDTWFVAGDVNASCNFNGLDVSCMVSYLKGGPAPIPCADCPPAAK